jgi:hypothetical protein
MEVGDPGRSAGGRKRDRTVPVVPQVPDQSKRTGRESEGAFTPTNSPFHLMFPHRPEAGTFAQNERQHIQPRP